LPVDVAYRYTPLLTVTVTSDVPAVYPPIVAILSEAFAVEVVKV
jgi:hypothetical protein